MYRLLIADDDDDVRELLRAQLERLGHNVVAEARNGEEAVRLAAQHAPNMAILDVRMPIMDGIDAAHKILHDNPCPVIFLTAYVEEDTVARAGETGAFYYLVKPFRTEDLAPAMTLSAARFNQYQNAQYLLERAKKDLDDRKTIERAKGLLMEQFGLTEQEAFKKIHFAARNSNRHTAAVAAEVLESGQVPS
ncbi:MAG: ANTAR domain-containing response regulator [Fimbriimonadales bacterium]